MPSANEFPSRNVEIALSIEASGTTSAAVQLYGVTPIALALPTPFTGTLASFEGAGSDGVFHPIYKVDGNRFTVVTAGDRHIPLDPAQFRGVQQLKITSNAVESAIRNITIMGVPQP